MCSPDILPISSPFSFASPGLCFWARRLSVVSAEIWWRPISSELSWAPHAYSAISSWHLIRVLALVNSLQWSHKGGTDDRRSYERLWHSQSSFNSVCLSLGFTEPLRSQITSILKLIPLDLLVQVSPGAKYLSSPSELKNVIPAEEFGFYSSEIIE